MVEPHSSNFRMITTNFLCVQIFKKFTVVLTCAAILDLQQQGVLCHQNQEQNALSKAGMRHSGCLIWNSLPDAVKSAQTFHKEQRAFLEQKTFYKRCLDFRHVGK